MTPEFVRVLRTQFKGKHFPWGSWHRLRKYATGQLEELEKLGVLHGPFGNFVLEPKSNEGKMNLGWRINNGNEEITPLMHDALSSWFHATQLPWMVWQAILTTIHAADGVDVSIHDRPLLSPLPQGDVSQTG